MVVKWEFYHGVLLFKIEVMGLRSIFSVGDVFAFLAGTLAAWFLFSRPVTFWLFGEWLRGQA